MNFVGTTGADNFVGGGAADTFDMSQGGKDFVSGNGGNDIFIFGAELRANDEIHGGNASDTLRLDGNYNTDVVFLATTMEGVETLEVAAGNNYRLTLNDGNVAAAQTLTVNGSLLGAADKLIFNGGAETNGLFQITGGLGNDILTGGGGIDTFHLSLGGDDTANGGGGNDVFNLVGSLTEDDRIDGGIGSNTVVLNADYALLRFKADTIVNVQFVDLFTLHDYKLIFHDGNVAAGATLVVTGHGGAANTVIADGSKETDGRFSFVGGSENDVFTGGQGNDGFNLTQGGDDIARGGLGADTFGSVLGNFTKADHIDGGDGADVFNIGGDYSGGLKISAGQMVNVEQMVLSAGFSYDFRITDGVVAAGQALLVFANTGAAQTVRFDGSAELDGSLDLRGGAGADGLTGGGVNDTITGGLGADKMAGGGESDTFRYQVTAADSTGLSHDTIMGFDALDDGFDIFGSVTVVDAEITSGKLRNGNFDSDLTDATIGLAANHAVLFTPDSGGLSGHTYLVVNTNGVAGYQLNGDLVIEMKDMQNQASFDIGNF